MASRPIAITAAWIVLMPVCLMAQQAYADDDSLRYHAAITKIFLSNYQAIPVFRLNPLSPGDVVQLDNETVFLSHARCYPGLNPMPLAIQPYETGTSIGISGQLKATGELLSKEVAQVTAGVSATVADTATITVSPLSETRVPDIQTLRNFANDPGCAIIPALLDKSIGKYIVAFGVLNGRVRFALTTTLSGQIDAKAEGEIIKLIAKSFSITDAEVKVTGNSASFVLTGLPGDLPLALIPASYSFPEMARITYYMQGARGAVLENLVNAAIGAPDPGWFQSLVQTIRVVLGMDESEQKHEQWVERFFSGEQMMTVEELKEHGREVDFRKVATYAAAHELLKRQ